MYYPMMTLTILISVMIYLLSNGSLVNINVTTTQSVALLNVTLPVEPLGPIIVKNASDSTVPALLIGDHLVIPVFGNGSFIIKYTPFVMTSPNGYLVMNVSSPYPIGLFISDNVLITKLPLNLITNFTRVSNGIILQLAPGNYSLGFIPEAPTAPTITSNTTTTPTTTTNSTTGIRNQTQVISHVTPKPSIISQYIDYIIMIVIAATVVLLAYLFVIRRRGPNVEPVIVEGLNPTDKEVLKALMDMGGEAYQADLQRKLNMPKATLWRAIRRLENAGYVQIIKEGRVNKIRLIKRPKFD